LSTPRGVRPGQLVAWWQDGGLALGVVAAEEKRRLRVVTEGAREQRIAPARVVEVVEPTGDVPGTTPDALAAAGERVAAAAERVGKLAGRIELPVLWEVMVEEEDEAAGRRELSVTELVGLALGPGELAAADDGVPRAAVLRALAEDGLRFQRRGDCWVPRGREEVERLVVQRRVEAERRRETSSLTERLRAAVAGEPFEPAGGALEQRWLDALEQLAILDDELPDGLRTVARQALSASGLRYDRPAEGAFRLLRRLGRFESDDENLQLLRYGLEREFPAEVVAAAEVAAGSTRPADDRDRRDLRRLEAVSIDGAHTREIDDLLSLEPRDRGWRLGVHIADPAAWIEPEGPVDVEARRRGLTRYLPDLRVTMLPERIAEDVASLVEDADRPALSFLVDLDDAGAIESFEIVRSTVRSRARLDYAGADRIVVGESTPGAPGANLERLLRGLAELAETRERARERDGAVLIRAAEVDLHVTPDGAVELERLDADSPSRRAVTEAMVLAGEVAGRFCVERGLPAIFRRQARPDGLPDLPPGGVADPVQVRALRRRLKRAEIGLAPGPHASLGVEAYVQVTSPLRRYLDLLLHRQLVSCLAGDERPAYDAETLRTLAAGCERAEIEARRAERAADDYWTLRYLESRLGEPVAATVIEAEPRPVVRLDETLWEQGMPSLGKPEPGARLQLRVERVNPRAGLLVLRAPGEPTGETGS
jgi:exoribonuclease-2